MKTDVVKTKCELVINQEMKKKIKLKCNSKHIFGYFSEGEKPGAHPRKDIHRARMCLMDGKNPFQAVHLHSKAVKTLVKFAYTDYILYFLRMRMG